ncbi:MAG TPA: haloacid dehalogenase [Lachnoclostridium phytofermentans]|uniref:Haloacid dehalogenase n=1 Tax=Lachnoclostridium phytofermentans TaxID=66219 RepID=A0A3D2XB63_9FIRM|nr:HAD family phosphatase [Lachnoclostridium sp.]HCL04184.1 haloacid dehalogenase [Lachnoclostridium phytofermentans]
MEKQFFTGVGHIEDMIFLDKTSDGSFTSGKEGVKAIFTPYDRKVEFIAFDDKTLCNVKSAMGYPAIYNVPVSNYEGPAKAILMDLDGTSVHSESFWMWIIEQTIAKLKKEPKFQLECEDEPHVSGHSVSEHLQYCIDKYCPDKKITDARKLYFETTEYEMKEILEGRGKQGAFTPAPGLKEFLTEVKGNGIKIGLVTSGLYNKAIPEIISAFHTLNMGDPFDFYDAIITAGQSLQKGQAGTIGELAPKPHPWLYSETARVGLGIEEKDKASVLGFEDSSAGVISIRLSGFQAIGLHGGNIHASGLDSLCLKKYDNLCDALPLILGR